MGIFLTPSTLYFPKQTATYYQTTIEHGC